MQAKEPDRVGQTAEEPTAKLRRALELHKAGRCLEALELYQALLALQPDDVGLLLNCGIAALQAGHVETAVDRLTRAAAARPDLAEAQFNLANALQRLNRYQEAEASYRRVLAHQPANAAAHNNLGAALQKLNRASEASGCFGQAIALKPDYAEAYHNLCQALRTLGRLDDAVRAGRRATEIRPDYADAHDSTGSALVDDERPDEAIDSFRRALSLRPNWTVALNHMAFALVQSGRSGDALKVVEACLQADPGNVEALAAQSVALNEVGDHRALRALMDCKRLIASCKVTDSQVPGGLTAFNQALADHIHAHPTLRFEPERHTTRLGLQSRELLIEPKGPLTDLEPIIDRAVAAYFEALRRGPSHPFLAKTARRTRLAAWGVVLGLQGHQAPHIHPMAWISGCYYVKVPKRVAQAKSGREGWIEFGLPFGRYRARAAPEVTAIRPEAGMLVLFPSFFYHSTVPFESDEERISIAFDVMPEA
jgi:uncharacterized protein (TIGR02466 family)